MNPSDPVYFELLDFIAGGTTPEQVANFRPSAEAQARVHELVERERVSILTPEEHHELDEFMALEHLLRMAKAKARLIIATQS
jgi:hypothetical protein